MTAGIILETRRLSKEFKGFHAVKDVDLQVRKGDIHAVIGPNGAGKTTLFNLLTHFLSPTAGTILFNGRDITSDRADQIAERGIVRSFQISAIFPNLTVVENVRAALQRRAKNSFAFWKSESHLDDLREQAIAILAQVDLDNFPDWIAGRLPYGKRRALELAATIALDPQLLLLDEPTQGMGHEDVDRVAQLIKRFSKGRTVLMVEHNMSVVASIADRITVLQRGSVIADGTYSVVSKDPLVVGAYMGSEASSLISPPSALD